MTNPGPRTEAATTWRTAGAVHVLAAHPELRDVFPVAVALDEWVRAGA
jgi:hypothetical protein